MRWFHPALQLLETDRRAGVDLDTIDVHGTRPESPAVSVVVPLYGRLDFLELQLAQWVLDPAMRDCELIYVLDQPEHTEQFRAEAMRLARLYDHPFVVATVTQNAGFSGRTTWGSRWPAGDGCCCATATSCRHDAGGWPSSTVRSTCSPGAVRWDRGCSTRTARSNTPDVLRSAGRRRVVAEPALLQGAPGRLRAGRGDPGGPGPDRCLPADGHGRVPAPRWLQDRFVQGDFEDSDLCLRIREEGRTTWYVAEVVLHHLEAMSYPSAMRTLVGCYNRWLHTELWDDTITELMADPRFAPTTQVRERVTPAPGRPAMPERPELLVMCGALAHRPTGAVMPGRCCTGCSVCAASAGRCCGSTDWTTR